MVGEGLAADQDDVETRRPGMRLKDLADILRLVEKRKGLIALVPHALK